MGRTAIVCDSTCDMGPTWLAEHDITMVPLKVQIGDKTYLDWVDLQPEEFYEKQAAAEKLPTTSQPSPAEFSTVYSNLAAQGYDAIVSIHLSSPLSGTIESANLAASSSPIPVHIVDTKLVTHAETLVIFAALEARDAGKSAEEIADAARAVAAKTRLFFALDTLEYLVKGGRAGKAQGLAASLLSIKPVLTFSSEGTIEPFKKVKGTKKAIQEMAATLAEDAKAGKVRVVIIQSIAEDLAAELRAEIEATGADIQFEHIGLIGACIGNHAGPRAVGVAYHPVG